MSFIYIYTIMSNNIICNTCEQEKETTEFYKQGSRYLFKCKTCYIIYYESKRYEKKKEYNKENRQIYLEKNKESIKNWSKEYYKKNLIEIKIKTNNYRSNRLKNDQLFRLAYNLRSLILSSFKSKGYRKFSKTENILGCSFDEFKLHIESKFESWMTFENRGKYNGELNYGWDLDHIIPISSAKTEEDLIKLNHYTNFQPLCSKINRYIKKDKYLCQN